jgi:hypothetical protein
VITTAGAVATVLAGVTTGGGATVVFGATDGGVVALRTANGVVVTGGRAVTTTLAVAEHPAVPATTTARRVAAHNLTRRGSDDADGSHRR